MMTLNILLYTCLAACVNSMVLPAELIKDHRAESASRLSTLPTNDDQHIIAVQASPSHPLSTSGHGNPNPKPLFRHEISEHLYLAKADGAYLIQPSNITTTLVRSTLLRVVSTTKYWTQVRETGHRGDTRPVIIWTKTTRKMISKLLKQLELQGMLDESDSPTTLEKTLNSIDRELQYLRGDVEADGQEAGWCTARASWIKSQTLSRLEEMAASLERL